MDKKIGIKAAGFGAVAALLIGGGLGGYLFNDPLGNNLEVYPVRLTTGHDSDGNNKLFVDADQNSQKCKSGKHPGCLLFKQDKVGTINFFVKNSKKKTRRCRDADDNERVITLIELTTQGSGEKGDFKRDDGGLVLEPWLKKNAFPSVDLDTGIAYEADPLGQARSRVFLTNMNDHEARDEDGNEVTKTFWYRVTVSDCPGTETWVSDPRGDNKGTGFD